MFVVIHPHLIAQSSDRIVSRHLHYICTPSKDCHYTLDFWIITMNYRMTHREVWRLEGGERDREPAVTNLQRHNSMKINRKITFPCPLSIHTDCCCIMHSMKIEYHANVQEAGPRRAYPSQKSSERKGCERQIRQFLISEMVRSVH
jgi:hypothetical protein